MDEAAEPADRGLRLTAAAALLGVSVTAFKRLVREGDGPAPRRLGPRTPVWLRSELLAWLKARAQRRR